jgi:carboxymethylenebutenolidase
MTLHVKIQSPPDGQPLELEGELAEPAGTTKAGGVVVIQEWHGVNDYVKSTCERFAEAGFVALAPDLYHGKVAKTKAAAAQMMGALDWKLALAEVGDATSFVKGHARSNGKVAVVGFCMGGALALESALRLDGLAGAVAFYGLPRVAADEFVHLKTPILGHFGRRDASIKTTAVEDIQKKVRSGGGQMDLHLYEAGHAFMRVSDPEVYDAASAAIAWVRTIEFLEKVLGQAR